MQRRLILLRHAKSSWNSVATDDRERPLNGRGRRNAPAVGQRLLDLGWRPEAVYGSDARRSRETWRRMEEALEDADVEVTFTPELYEGGLGEIVSLAAGWSPAHATVLVIGHNPGFEEAVEELTGRHEKLTTCNAALLVGRGRDWNEALAGEWVLEGIIRPRDLEVE
ncbi:MAG: histidine phosphatase family protein [Planctomycetes bacterium]|nr:histidine phosphatase family protein [Planctomycetota bacterium]